MATFDERHDFKAALAKLPFVTDEFMKLFNEVYGDRIEWAIKSSDLWDSDEDILLKFYVDRWSGKQLIDYLGNGVAHMMRRRKDALIYFSRWFWWVKTNHKEEVNGDSLIDVLWINPKTIKTLHHVAINTVDELCSADFETINRVRDMSNKRYTEMAIAVEQVDRHLSSYEEWAVTGVYRFKEREEAYENAPATVIEYCQYHNISVEDLVNKPLGFIASIDVFSDDELTWLMSHSQV